MLSRRDFLYTTTLLTGGIVMGYPFPKNISSHRWYMPDEGEIHTRTWMAFIANKTIWTTQQIPEVEKNLALIATTIAKYEPLSILVRKEDYAKALHYIGTTHRYPIEFIITNLNDLWIRDTGATFVINDKNQKAGIDFNFNGWGKKQIHHFDAQVAQLMTQHRGMKRLSTDLVLEGGCFEVDGHGLAIMSESSILNSNRNPNKSKAEIEKELKSLLGLERIIWLEGIKGRDITDGHIDFYARFVRPGVIVAHYDPDTSSYDHTITRKNIQTLQSTTNIEGKPFEVVVLDGPMQFNERFGLTNFAVGYVGYYLCNNAVIMQKFGDKKADQKAKKTLEKLFPTRTIEQISIDGIASGGGTIHCTTQQEPHVGIFKNTI